MPMNDWEIIADNLSRAGWSYGYVSALDRNGCTIWIADAHRDGKRFIVRADELLTAFLELERAVCNGLLTEQIYKLRARRRSMTNTRSGSNSRCWCRQRLLHFK